MLDKYFGFTEINNEFAVIESLLEHARIDEEELYLSLDLIKALYDENKDDVYSIHLKISKIRNDSNRVFEYTEEQIIQANFDFQKQYDFLRIYQRIENISTDILNLSNQMLVLSNIGGKIPVNLQPYLDDIFQLILAQHTMFKEALSSYEKDRANIIKRIHKVVESEKAIKEQYVRALEALYKLANENKLLLGNLRAVESIFSSLDVLSNRIEQATTSLEWLLIN
ncbi:hypothetical protein DID76_01165 [Candidatus Marinamargulisbacteria bacterium SCGC AG-414-C22]|nr:hypothetical protein DID76_01165 [Candidatus Marinamargulisbacteria bacterium SCGC AG-414-C22]